MATAPTPPTAAPTAPDRADRATFSTRATTWADYQKNNLVPEMTALAQNAYDNALDAATQAGAAQSSATASAASATLSAGMAAAAGATAWVSGTAYSIGDVRYSPADLQSYRRKTAGAGTTDPSLDATNWARLLFAAEGALKLSADTAITTASSLGSTSYFQALAIDSTRDLLIVGGSTSMHAVIYNSTTQTFGSPVLLRAVADCQFAALLTAANTVLLCSCPNGGTAMETVVLSLIGSTITVNTPLATTLAGASSISTGKNQLVAVGSSYLIEYGNASNVACLRAITVSGVTPSIGAELALTGFNSSEVMQTYAVNSSVALAIHCANTTLYATPVSVSGTTLTAGTQATTTMTARAGVCSVALSSGRWGVIYQNSTLYGGIISVSGTTATISVVNLTGSITAASMAMYAVGSKALVTAGAHVAVLSDSAGTAVAGTTLSVSSPSFCGYNSAGTAVLVNAGTGGATALVGISGNNPSLTASFGQVLDTTTTHPDFGKFTQDRSRIANGTLRTAAGSHSVVSSNTYAFSPVSSGSAYAVRANTFALYNVRNVRQNEAWGIELGAGNVVNLRKVTMS